MKLSFIWVTYNSADLITESIKSVLADTAGYETEIVVIDNKSADDSADVVARNFPHARLVGNDTNVGFAAGCNQGYALSGGDYVFLVNPDAVIRPGSVKTMVDYMVSDPECAVAGGLLMNPSGGKEPSARRFPNCLYKLFMLSGLSHGHPKSRIFGRPDYTYADFTAPAEVDWVPGAFIIISRKMLEQLGFFDERFYLYYEETDLCLRARRNGWRIVFLPSATAVHVGGASGKTRKEKVFQSGGSQLMEFRLRSEYLYYRKNFGLISVLMNSGVEILWHCARIMAAYLRSGRSSEKIAESKIFLKHITSALRDTSFGAVCPRRPW